MKNSTRFSGAPPARVADHRQAKILLPEHHHARVGALPKSSPPIAERPVNHLAWYVPLKTKESERKIPRIHQIKWKRPPKISLNPEWQVAAGEESKLTAVTPSSSLTWPLVEADCYDDNQTPIIPIIPIEEVGAEIPSDTPVTAITSANPQPSASCPSAAECSSQHVHEKSLPHRLHGLEGDDLIAASAAITFGALMQNRTIDIKLVVKYLTDLLIEKVKSEDGLASKPEDEAQPASKSNTCLHLPSLTLASKVEKIINVCIEPMRKAALSDSTPQTVNHSLILPSSKDETYIKKCASKLGGTGSGSHLPKADRQSSALSCTKFVSDISICASKLGGMHAGSGLSRQRAEEQTPFLPCSKAETKNKAANKPRGMHVGNRLSTPKADNQTPLPPCSEAETEINKTVREMCAESAGGGLSRQRAENQTPSLPSKSETESKAASKPGGMRVGNGLSTPKTDTQSPFPPCSKAETEMSKTVRKPGRMCAESGICTVKTKDQSSLFPCSKSVLGINSCASILGDLQAGSGFKKQKAENRSPLLPCSKVGTTINKAVGKLGGMHAVSGQSTPKTYNQSPLMPCTKAVTESNNSASKLGGMRAVSGSHSQKADNQSPLLACSIAETKINKTVLKPGGMCDGSGLGTSKAAVSEINICASKLGGMHDGPGTSKAAVSEINSCASKLGGMHAPSGQHIQKAENQSSFLPCPKSDAELNKDASTLRSSGPPATKGEKRPSPSPGLNSDRPTKKLTGESGGPARPCTDQIVREQKARTLVSKDNGGSDFTGVKPVNSLSPYPSKPKMKEVKKMIHDYGSYDVAQVKPMAPPVAPPSVLPNEEMDRMLDKYLLLDRGRRQPFVGPSPLLHLPTAPSPVTNLRANPNAPDPYFNGTGTFHLSLQPMSPGRQVNLQYHQPQIQRRGEIPNTWQSGNHSQGHNINRRVEMNPIYQRPCMHFSDPARCPNGYNCPYQHDMSRQWSGTPVEPWWPRR